MSVAPLPIGTTLADRFELLEVLGAGAFTIAYRARDVLRGDECTVKELAPDGTSRDEQGVLDLTRSGVAAQHLRQRFHEEARRVGRMHLPSVMPVRATFSERGTAYFATDFDPDATTIERILLTDGRMAVEVVD